MPLFRANGFYLNSDFEHLLELSGDDFKAMGIKKGVCVCVFAYVCVPCVCVCVCACVCVCTIVVYIYQYVFATIQFFVFCSLLPPSSH